MHAIPLETQQRTKEDRLIGLPKTQQTQTKSAWLWVVFPHPKEHCKQHVPQPRACAPGECCSLPQGSLSKHVAQDHWNLNDVLHEFHLGFLHCLLEPSNPGHRLLPGGPWHVDDLLMMLDLETLSRFLHTLTHWYISQQNDTHVNHSMTMLTLGNLQQLLSILAPAVALVLAVALVVTWSRFLTAARPSHPYLLPRPVEHQAALPCLNLRTFVSDVFSQRRP